MPIPYSFIQNPYRPFVIGGLGARALNFLNNRRKARRISSLTRLQTVLRFPPAPMGVTLQNSPFLCEVIFPPTPWGRPCMLPHVVSNEMSSLPVLIFKFQFWIPTLNSQRFPASSLLKMRTIPLPRLFRLRWKAESRAALISSAS